MFALLLPVIATQPGTKESRTAKLPMLRAALMTAWRALNLNQKAAAGRAGLAASTFNEQLNGHGPNSLRLLDLGRDVWTAGKGALLRTWCELAGITRNDVLEIFDVDQASEDDLRRQLQEQADRLADLEKRDSQRQEQIDSLTRLVRESLPTHPIEAPAEERERSCA